MIQNTWHATKRASSNKHLVFGWMGQMRDKQQITQGLLSYNIDMVCTECFSYTRCSFGQMNFIARVPNKMLSIQYMRFIVLQYILYRKKITSQIMRGRAMSLYRFVHKISVIKRWRFYAPIIVLHCVCVNYKFRILSGEKRCLQYDESGNFLSSFSIVLRVSSTRLVRQTQQAILKPPRNKQLLDNKSGISNCKLSINFRL